MANRAMLPASMGTKATTASLAPARLISSPAAGPLGARVLISKPPTPAWQRRPTALASPPASAPPRSSSARFRIRPSPPRPARLTCSHLHLHLHLHLCRRRRQHQHLRLRLHQPRARVRLAATHPTPFH